MDDINQAPTTISPENYLEKIRGHFKCEKYFQIYAKIIRRGLTVCPQQDVKNIFMAKKYTNEKYGKYKYEAHHILPKCLCETKYDKNDINNISFLTIKEHFICHRILALKTNSIKLLRAFYAMFTKRTKEQRITPPTTRDYALFKRNAYKLCSRPKELNGMYGRHHTSETKNKISEKNKGRKLTQSQKLKYRSVQLNRSEENSWNQIIKFNSAISKTYANYKELSAVVLERFPKRKTSIKKFCKDFGIGEDAVATIIKRSQQIIR